MTATLPDAGDQRLARRAWAEEIGARTAGRPLPGHLYTDPEMHEADLEWIFASQWFLAATAAEMPEPGDYVTLDLGRRSVIVLRDDDGVLRAFHNVCRHRGARLLTEPTGFVGNLVCAYHSWTYGSDGRLLHAPGLPAGTDTSRPSSPSCGVETRPHVWRGFLDRKATPSGIEISGLVSR